MKKDMYDTNGSSPELLKIMPVAAIACFATWLFTPLGPITSTICRSLVISSSNIFLNKFKDKKDFSDKVNDIYNKSMIWLSSLRCTASRGLDSITDIQYGNINSYLNYYKNEYIPQDNSYEYIDNEIMAGLAFCSDTIDKVFIKMQSEEIPWATPKAEDDVKKISEIFYNYFENEIENKMNIDNDFRHDILLIRHDSNINKLFGEYNVLKMRIDKLEQKYNSSHTEENEIRYRQLVEHNQYYKLLYNKTLFLEESLNDGIELLLSDVFVMPKLYQNNCRVEEKLIEWMTKSNPLSRQRSDGNAPIYLLYGKAGVGKSSLCSYLIHEQFFERNCEAVCYAIPLSEHIDEITMEKPYDFVSKYFLSVDTDKIVVFILDGLDEVCVLKEGFDGNRFLQELRKSVMQNNSVYKILITSRPGYFDKVNTDRYLIEEILYWDKDTIVQWCSAYTSENFHFTSRKKWCNDFIEQYNNNNWSEEKKEIFCIPLILYMSCVSEVNLCINKSLSEIYEQTFDFVGRHAYVNGVDWQIKDLEKRKQIDWQYTKELAYQAFLNDKISTTLSLDENLIEKARIQTSSYLKEYLDSTEDSLKDQSHRYLGCYHFVSEDKKNHGVEFAHKTVCEYFTAVKIYEDYLKRLDKSADLNTVWDSIFEAFRYKNIHSEIFKDYLKVLIYRPGDKFDKENFILKFIEGMKEQQLFYELSKGETIAYKTVSSNLPSKNISCVFRNLTWFLTDVLDYKNERQSIDIGIYLHDLTNINCSNWYLKKADLNRTQLTYANLNGANLKEANLHGANLKEANLDEAKLQGADLKMTNLKNANMRGAHLDKSLLQGAELQMVNLKEACLVDANLEFANLENAILESAILNGSMLFGAILDKANLNNAELNNANLQVSSLKFACLKSANLFEANLMFSNLLGANLNEAILENTILYEANLKVTNLQGANLKGAVLNGAILNGAILIGANLQGANLKGAILNGAILNGANLKNVVLENTEMTSAYYDSDTIFPNSFNPIDQNMVEI